MADLCYPLVVLYLSDVEITHTEANGYECDQADCICHWERRIAEYDPSPYAHCDCSSCEYIRSVLTTES